MHTEFSAGFHLRSHIHLRGGIFAYEHDGESGPDALLEEICDFLLALRKDRGRYGFSVDELHGDGLMDDRWLGKFFF
jgi:hypothetical protein